MSHASRVVRDAILALKKPSGIIAASDVVMAARDPKSPLHSRFTWDDSEAAHQWRLQQARQLISVCVTVSEHTQKNERVFVSLNRDQYAVGGGYRVMAEVLSDEQLRRERLRSPGRRLR